MSNNNERRDGMYYSTRRVLLEEVSKLYYEGKIKDKGWEECVGCPFRGEYGVCYRHELYFGCVKWEEDMGEDL